MVRPLGPVTFTDPRSPRLPQEPDVTSHSTRAVLPLALVAGTVVLAVSGCGGSAATAPTPTNGDAPTVTATPSAATPVATGSDTPSSAADGACRVADLRIRYADAEGGGGAGSVTGALTFTSTGSTVCTLAGFPGVSYVGGGDTQVGQAATRTGDPVRTRTLAPGTSVEAVVRRTQPRNYGEQCEEAPVDGFRVYPPGSTESAFVAFRTTGCRSADAPLLRVGPVG